MIYYLVFSTFIVYFIISILSRELYWTASGVIVYKYQGKRAVMLSFGFLFLFIFFGWMIIDQNNIYSLNKAALSLVFAVPLGVILRMMLISMHRSLGVEIGETTRKRTKKSMTEWAIAGFFISLPINFLLYFFLKYTINITTAIVTMCIVTISSILFFSFWGSRTVFE